MRIKRSQIKLAILASLLLVVIPCVSLAQNISGTILGTVKDSSGAVVASAPVGLAPWADTNS
jgi:hypothetical protein